MPEEKSLTALVTETLETLADPLLRDPDVPVEALATIGEAVARLAKLLLDDSRVAEARLILHTCLETLPNAYPVLLCSGELELDEGFFARALAFLQRARELRADDPEVYKHLAATYERMEDYTAADQMWRRGFPNGAITAEFTENIPGRPRVLAILTPLMGNIRFRNFMRPEDFHIHRIHAESYHAGVVLPECDAVFVGIGDPDLCPRALDKAQAIIDQVQKPYINDPRRVRRTGREETAQRLAGLQHVVVPRVRRFSRAELTGPESAALLETHGFSMPLLLRLPGYHSGQKFELVNSLEEVRQTLVDMPGDHLLVISYLNLERPDGSFRKYRVMRIAGELYPLHLAISYDWKVHYFSAEMETHPEFRAEEEAYLQDLPGTVGTRGLAALQAIFEKIDLDYAGADFAVDDSGNIVVYEANPGMLIEMPAADPRWDYRRPAIARALSAARRMSLAAAGIPPEDPRYSYAVPWTRPAS